MGGSDDLLEPLTQREREILPLLAEGLSDREIAERLILARGTVKWYNKQLYSKLSVHSRSEAVARAWELGLLQGTAKALPGGTVTFLFTDIEGSTRLWEQQPDAMKSALKQHDALLRREIEGNGGRVFKTMGDAFCAVFDDAVKALSAAHAAQIAILDQDWEETPIRVRMVLHTGTAEVRDDDYFGPSVNHVARLLAAGHGGQILLSAATQALLQRLFADELSIRDLGEHRLKDLDRPERIYQFIVPDLPTDFPPLNSLSAYSSNLPVQLTSFVGREREIAEVKRLLGETRLLTLTGPPGTGKTRLGLRVAADVLNEFEDGVYFVELAPISDPALVPNTIAQLFGVRETTGQPLIKTLEKYLRDRQLLLLIDNFEQVIDAAPLVGDLLYGAPGVKALVTSREALRVYGEQEYAVPPLSLPDEEGSESLPGLSQYEAVELFCQRARAVKSDFTLTDGNASNVADICVRLDGLPLAIELAAARSKVLTPESMFERLDNRLLTLTGGARNLPARMQTLRAAIDWSYDLLEADEQRLFDRLSVFQGGRTIEAVEAICDSELSFTVLDGLESLLNKNLLYSAEGRTGETRFYMLETIHEYARERLIRGGEADELKRRHALYFVALAERAGSEFHGARQEHWFEYMADEVNNIRAILTWTLAGLDVELGARLIVAMADFWYFKGLFSESSTWIERALESEEKISPDIRVKTLTFASRLAYACGNHAYGERLARQALLLAREIKDNENYARAHVLLGAHLMASNYHIKEAMTSAEEGLRLFRELDHELGISIGLNIVGEIARLNGNYPRAAQIYEECLALSIEMGNKHRQVMSLANLSYIAYHQGDYERAINYGNEALAFSSSLHMEYPTAINIAVIAGPIGATGEPSLAARLLAASERQLEAMGASIQPADKFEVDQFKEAIRERLGEPEFNKAWAEGQAMSFEEAIAYALGEDLE